MRNAQFFWSRSLVTSLTVVIAKNKVFDKTACFLVALNTWGRARPLLTSMSPEVQVVAILEDDRPWRNCLYANAFPGFGYDSRSFCKQTMHYGPVVLWLQGTARGAHKIDPLTSDLCVVDANCPAHPHNTAEEGLGKLVARCLGSAYLGRVWPSHFNNKQGKMAERSKAPSSGF